ncbi:MAG: DUF1592 domain-containing protein [Polyangiaceae bacterium]
MKVEFHRLQSMSRHLCVAAALVACSPSIGEDPSSGRTGGGRAGGSGAGAGGTGAATGGPTGSGATGVGGASTGVGGNGGSSGGGGSGTGGGGAGGTGGGTSACSGGVNAGASRMLRITRRQYNNAVEDLLGETSRPADTFIPDEMFGHFAGNATASVTLLGVEDYLTASEKISKSVATRLASVVPCDPAKGDETCARNFVAKFAPRAYGRPLASDEIDALIAVYRSLDAAATPAPTFADRISLALQAVLQSPDFLYQLEKGQGNAAPLLPLTPHELARRLSFAIWNSVPDPTLLDDAAAGRLATPAAIGAQVTRMMADPKFLRAIDSFHAQWLGIQDSGALNKDPAVFPEFTPELAAAAITETREFVRHLFQDGDGRLATLLSASFSYVNPALAKFYGISYPGTGTGFVRVDLPAGQRAGVLTQASVVAAHAHANQTSPVRRGLFLLTNVFCTQISPPPPDVDTTPPNPDPNATTRERFKQHTAKATCASCHRMMDPLGFGFEAYDGAGKFRTIENGKPIDATGTITGTDVDGNFNGALELLQRVQGSAQVKSCVSQLWLEYALSRVPTPEDACSLQQAEKGFATSGYNLRDLIASVVSSDAFRHVRITP